MIASEMVDMAAVLRRKLDAALRFGRRCMVSLGCSLAARMRVDDMIASLSE